MPFEFCTHLGMIKGVCPQLCRESTLLIFCRAVPYEPFSKVLFAHFGTYQNAFGAPHGVCPGAKKASAIAPPIKLRLGTALRQQADWSGLPSAHCETPARFSVGGGDRGQQRVLPSLEPQVRDVCSWLCTLDDLVWLPEDDPCKLTRNQNKNH